MNQTATPATIAADPEVPVIRIHRDFDATPAQLFRAHTDPDIFLRWIGPDGMGAKIEQWDARTGGSWARRRRWRERPGLPRLLPRGASRPHRADLHVGGHARRRRAGDDDLRGPRQRPDPPARQLAVRQLRGRDGWLQSGMEVGIDQGYAKLDKLVADGAL